MSLPYIGELAALGTAVCWALTALAFESAGKRVGSLPVNLIRLVIGYGFLVALTWIRRGHPLPWDADAHAWLWLGISGLIGFAFGDLCLFRAFVLIGSRLSVLLMSLVPPVTALIGWAVLGEEMGARECTGMALTIAGVTWVVLERPAAGPERVGMASVSGILLGLGGVVGQAAGLVLSKHGMGDYDPFAANQIRVLAGIAGFAVLFTATRAWRRVLSALLHGHAMSRMTIGAFFGPFLGVSLSLVAVQNTTAGVAATIMAITPVMILPASVFLLKDRVTMRAVAGAILAVAGTAVLFS